MDFRSDWIIEIANKTPSVPRRQPRKRLTSFVRCYVRESTVVTGGFHLRVSFCDDFTGWALRISGAFTAYGRHAALMRKMFEQVAVKTVHCFLRCTNRFSRDYYMHSLFRLKISFTFSVLFNWTLRNGMDLPSFLLDILSTVITLYLRSCRLSLISPVGQLCGSFNLCACQIVYNTFSVVNQACYTSVTRWWLQHPHHFEDGLGWISLWSSHPT